MILDSTARILTNITKLFIIGLQICVIKLNGDRWVLLRKFSHMNINTPTTSIKKTQDKVTRNIAVNISDEEFLGDNYPYISQDV